MGGFLLSLTYNPVTMKSFLPALAALMLLLAGSLCAQSQPRTQWGFHLGPQIHMQAHSDIFPSNTFRPRLGLTTMAAFRIRIVGPLSIQPAVSISLARYMAEGRYTGSNTPIITRAAYHDIVGYGSTLLRVDAGRDKLQFFLTAGPEIVFIYAPPSKARIYEGDQVTTYDIGGNFFKPQGAVQASLGYKLPIESRHDWTVEAFGRLHQMDPRTFDYPMKHMSFGLRAGLWLRNEAN